MIKWMFILVLGILYLLGPQVFAQVYHSGPESRWRQRFREPEATPTPKPTPEPTIAIQIPETSAEGPVPVY